MQHEVHYQRYEYCDPDRFGARGRPTCADIEPTHDVSRIFYTIQHQIASLSELKFSSASERKAVERSGNCKLISYDWSSPDAAVAVGKAIFENLHEGAITAKLRPKRYYYLFAHAMTHVGASNVLMPKIQVYVRNRCSCWQAQGFQQTATISDVVFLRDDEMHSEQDASTNADDLRDVSIPEKHFQAERNGHHESSKWNSCGVMDPS
jgi:hypothetical protein